MSLRAVGMLPNRLANTSARPIARGVQWRTRSGAGGLCAAAPIRTIGVLGRIEREKGTNRICQGGADCARNISPSADSRSSAFLCFRMLNITRESWLKATDLRLSFLDGKTMWQESSGDLDLLVVPSTAAEATTRVILEAYSAGVCVVALPSGGIPEVLQDGRTGFLTNGGPQNP